MKISRNIPMMSPSLLELRDDIVRLRKLVDLFSDGLLPATGDVAILMRTVAKLREAVSDLQIKLAKETNKFEECIERFEQRENLLEKQVADLTIENTGLKKGVEDLAYKKNTGLIKYNTSWGDFPDQKDNGLWKIKD